MVLTVKVGFPGCTSGKEPTCLCRRFKRCGLHSRVCKIPWRGKWQPTPVFLPEKFHGTWQATVHGVTNNCTWLSNRACTIMKVQRVIWASSEQQKNKAFESTALAWRQEILLRTYVSFVKQSFIAWPDQLMMC